MNSIDFSNNFDFWIQQLSLSAPESLEYLNKIQNTKEAWNLAFNLLDNQNLTCKFYGAHTLFHKIARNWNQLQLEQTSELGLKIIHLIQNLNQQKVTQNSSDQLFSPIIRKLLQTLVWYQFYTFQQVEKTDFIQQTLNQFPLSDNINLSISNELIKLDYLKLVPEEHLSAPNSLNTKSVGITDYLHKSIDLILQTLQPHLVAKSLESSEDLLFQKSLATLQSWTTFGLPIESIPNLVQLLIQQLSFKDRIFPIGKTLQEILNHPNSFKVQLTLFNILLPTLCNPSLLGFISELQQSETDNDSTLPLCQLYVDFCETFSELIMEKIIYENNRQVYDILEALLNFTNYPGYCPIDQTITEECLLVWATLQDSYQSLDEDSINRSNQIGNKDGALNFFKRLLDVLLVKIQFPIQEELSDWTQNDNHIFKVFRRDVGDLFINTYYLMGSEMAQYYFNQANQLISHLAHQSTNTDSWQALESILFLILKISEPMNDNIPTLNEISSFFTNQTLELLIEGSFSSIQLKQTIFQIIGEYASYIKDNHQLLVLCISKSLSVLANSQLSTTATSAFGKLCNIARDDLVNSIHDLINTYLSIAHNIVPELLDKILKGLFNILYKLHSIDPNKFQLEMDRIVSNLLDVIEQTIIQGKMGDFSNLSISSPTMENSPKDLWVEQLVQRIHNLTACCNGLKPSNGFEVSELIVDTLQLPQSIMSPLCQRLYLALVECLNLIGGQEVMVEAISRLIAAGLDTDGIAVPFVFPLNSLLEMLINSYLSNPNINSYLSWFSRVVNIYGSSSNMSLKSQLFFNNNLTQEQPQTQYDDGLLGQALQRVLPAFFGIVTDLESMEIDLDLSLSMVNLLSRFTKCDLKSILTLPSHLIDSIFMFNLTGLSVQNRFLLKAHLGLTVDLLSSHKEEEILIKNFPQVKFIKLSDMIQNQGIGKLICDKLLLGVGKDTPKSCIVNVTEVLHHLLLSCKGLANQWLRELLSQENYPTNLVDTKTKDRFTSKLLITNSLKERKKLCEVFGLSCRGYDL